MNTQEKTIGDILIGVVNNLAEIQKSIAQVIKLQKKESFPDEEINSIEYQRDSYQGEKKEKENV